jgi:single-stranded-DNA-specific exonuclease
VKFRWSVSSPDAHAVGCLVETLRFSPLLAQCLVNRGLSEPEVVSHFLDPRLKYLADPFLIPNMAIAVERLIRAREVKEPIVIFGDYDVDGVSSTALLTEVFTSLGFCVNAYLPHRFDEGYGLSRDGVENCLRKFPAKLVLAVDCGSTATETIDWLGGLGIEVIVLDHHQVSNPAPRAVALVNPQLRQEQPTFQELCSVGLAFKLAHALTKRLREQNDPMASAFDIRPLLDLVALGTIADIVPLTGENRILVTRGLEALCATQRPGLIALKEVAQVTEEVGSYHVGFQLAPRLNAAGRLETAEESLHLLRAAKIEDAMPIAQSLDARNRERQKIEKAISDEVIAALRTRFNPEKDFAIVEGQSSWHIGVVGIVASRVMHEFYRPTFIIGGDGEHWRGSGRSVEGFDLAAALRECSDLLIRHGGHAMAAGVTVHPDKVEAFRLRLNELARAALTPEQLKPALRLDAEASLSDLTIARIEELEQMKPFGHSNPQVQVALRRVSHQRPPQRLGKESQHVKFWVTDGKTTAEALWWNCGKDASLPKVMYDLACVPQINEFNGRRSVQLKVLDWNSVV